MYMNIAILLLKNPQDKSKINYIQDFCNKSTLFIGLHESFLFDNILDS